MALSDVKYKHKQTASTNAKQAVNLPKVQMQKYKFN